MQMTGKQQIAAARQEVWRALNDPDVLRRCIPGCQSLDKESDQRLRAAVEIKIGPIGARFTGAVTLSDVDPPNGYTIAGEGQGGTVGSAKGSAKVRLAEENGGTLLTYEVDAHVGGRLAQLGGPIIDATAKQLAGKFFNQFAQVVAGTAPTPSATVGVTSQASTQIQPQTRNAAGWLMAVALAAAALVGFFVGQAMADGGSTTMGLAMGLLVVIVGVAGYEFGRRIADGARR